MKRDEDFPRKLLVCLAVLATCASIAASASTREKRHVGKADVSSHRQSAIQTSDGLKPSTSKNNDIAGDAGRKVTHRLIGGHLRVDSKGEREEGSPWDDGILMSSAGNGKEEKHNRPDDDDEKKTLSQQVKEGKYGLIQNEIYGARPKRPGIISYLGNPEVPRDTVDNLGGLDEDDIWLAENHVLVLRGGKFPADEKREQDGGEQAWPPIDDYEAPRRQVEIPSRPRVPPPFPVQLADGAPVQIIGPNGTTHIANGTLDYETDPLYAKGVLPGEGPFFAVPVNGTLVTPDRSRPSAGTNVSGPPDSDGKRTKGQERPPGAPPSFYHAIPPGAVFVAPPSNQTDYDDEDQSIYYPPPYSFRYKQDNTTAVPPGPLVPGIILPPPPDFFSSLDEKKPTTKKYAKRPATTPSPRQRPTYLPPRKLTTKHYKSSTGAPKTTASVPVTVKSYGRIALKNATGRPAKSEEVTAAYEEVTTPSSDKPTTLDSGEFYSVGPVGNQVWETTTREKSRAWLGITGRKTVPALDYFPTTTASSLERPVEVTPASVKSIVTTAQPGRVPGQASYYFYEESSDEPAGTTPNPSAIYYRTTTESPYYKVEANPVQEQPKRQYYSVEPLTTQRDSKDYSVKLIDSLIKDPQVYRYSDSSVPSTSSRRENAPARSQSQRMLVDRPAVRYQTISERPDVAVQSYYTTPRPQTYYRDTEPVGQYDYATPGTTPKAIYQYSFEAADYAKRNPASGEQYYKHEQQQGQRQPQGQQQEPQQSQQQQRQQQQQHELYEYQDIKSDTESYDYDDAERVTEQQLDRENVPYKIEKPVYPSTTGYPILDATPNPQHAYFTRQDEKLLDDVTKEYFTIFGQKLSGKGGVPSTTPMYAKTGSATDRPAYDTETYVPNDYRTQPGLYKTPDVKVHYGDQPERPYSLKDDTLVNFKHPLPPINPDAEFVTIVEPEHRQQQSRQPLQSFGAQREDFEPLQGHRGSQGIAPIRGYTSERLVQRPNRPSNEFVESSEAGERGQPVYRTRPVSLHDDVAVNYRDPRPPINPDAEFIDPIDGPDGRPDNRPDKANAYFAYRLPGDGGHFYFLTPQAIAQRQDRNGAYLYARPRESRLLRRRRGPGNV